MNRVVRHYSGYIAALSTRTSYGPDGYPRPQVDEDLRPVGIYFNYGLVDEFMREWLLRQQELHAGEITRGT